MKKLSVLLYGVVCYSIFLFTFLYAIGFTGNILVPKSIDSGPNSSGAMSLLIDICLLSLFALQHSIMARPAFKKWWTRFIPASIERSTYVLLASLALLLLFWKWSPFQGIVWEFKSGVGKYFFSALFVTGWIIVLLSTFMINHFDLFGLKQVFYYFKNKPADDLIFKTNWLYRIVRHPIMLGFIIAFWSAPVMTAGHCLFAIVTTMYILFAIQFLEERDLQKSIGSAYKAYKNQVPMLIPFSKKTRLQTEKKERV